MSLMKWMFYVGLLITAADVLIALALANYGSKSAAKNSALEQSHRAQASGPRRPGDPGVRIDWERSALVNGLVPAQFAVAEDNKTYDLSGQAGPLMEILQIQAVVTRAVAQQAQPAPAGVGAGAVATPSAMSVGERLQELKALHDSGALSDQEYTSKRARIIADI
jgi:Short C-terminal domain